MCCTFPISANASACRRAWATVASNRRRCSTRAAYRWSCEVSVYVSRARHRGGLGRALYLELFDRLTALGYRTAVAGVTLPNDASEALHKSLGFEWVGCYQRVGWKNGAWHDVAQYQRPLGVGTDEPAGQLRVSTSLPRT